MIADRCAVMGRSVFIGLAIDRQRLIGERSVSYPMGQGAGLSRRRRLRSPVRRAVWRHASWTSAPLRRHGGAAEDDDGRGRPAPSAARRLLCATCPDPRCPRCAPRGPHGSTRPGTGSRRRRSRCGRGARRGGAPRRRQGGASPGPGPRTPRSSRRPRGTRGTANGPSSGAGCGHACGPSIRSRGPGTEASSSPPRTGCSPAGALSTGHA